MKHIFIIVSIGFCFSCVSHKKQQSNVEIISQKEIKNNGTHLRLKNVLDDSRCPKGVNCIWAGEVIAQVEVYQDKKLIEDKKISFNSKNSEENINWISKYYPNKKIKSIGVLPYPADGEQIKPEDYFIEIVFL